MRPACVLVILLFVDSGVMAAPAEIAKFVKQNCLDCHQGKSAEGGLDLGALTTEVENFSSWVRVFDRVRLGEMPPKDANKISAVQRTAFVSSARSWLTAQQRKQWRELGRVQGRRLTNIQLERTLHDLLGVDIPLANQMPEEPKSSGFTTVAHGQTMSRYHLQEYLKSIDSALEEAFRRAISGDSPINRRLDGRRISRRRPNRRTREPELINGLAVTWSSRLIFYGRIPATQARESGWYRFKIRAKGLKCPEDHGVWCTVRSGKCVSSAPLLDWIGAFQATPEMQEWTFEAWLPAGDMLEIRPGDSTLKSARFQGGQVGAGEGGPQNVPGVAIQSLEMEQIHHGLDNDSIRSILFDDLKVRTSSGTWRDAELDSSSPKQDLSRLMMRFANRAFRRPVKPSDIETYVNFAQRSLDDGMTLSSALRLGYRSLLCSPRFLYLTENPGPLDHYAIASRLSYFLWNSMPDQVLVSLAERKQLDKPAVIRQQVRRMLGHGYGKKFVGDFAAQWLDLSEIDFTTPDRRLYRTFDVIVQNSMVGETERFLQELVDHDLSVRSLIKSDHTYLNERLARFYEISGVKSGQLERTKLKDEDHRGGLLTHGSILKVTANGTNTSPVIRGVWISERLLGEQIPPPPSGVAAIEPDVRGTKTIREMLAKHKSNPSCASCHRTIDPPGFALENFDPAGRWRDRYLQIRGRRVNRGSRVDPSYEFSSGEHFNGLREFQAIVAKKPGK